MFTLSAVLYPIAGIIGLIIFLALIGLKRGSHSQPAINHAILAPVAKSVKTENVVAVQNMITNVRWPINS